MRFSFKLNRPTGRYSWANHTSIDIKLDRKVVGSIGYHKKGYSGGGAYKIGFTVIKDGDNFKDSNPNCSWMWIRLKPEFETIEEAKDYFIQNQAKYMKLPFFCRED